MDLLRHKRGRNMSEKKIKENFYLNRKNIVLNLINYKIEKKMFQIKK